MLSSLTTKHNSSLLLCTDTDTHTERSVEEQEAAGGRGVVCFEFHTEILVTFLKTAAVG